MVGRTDTGLQGVAGGPLGAEMGDPNLDQTKSAGSELNDSTGRALPFLAGLEWRALANPLIHRAAGMALVSLAILVWPDRNDRILARLVGIAVLVAAVGLNRDRGRSRGRRLIALVTALLAGGVGLFLVFGSRVTASQLGVAIGAVWAIMVARSLLLARRRVPRGSYLRGGLQAGTAVVLLLFPREVLATTTSLVALILLGGSLLVIVLILNRSIVDPERPEGVTALLTGWLLDRPKSSGARGELYDKILFDGPDSQRRFVRFFVLMGFAAAIGALGVISDSTAVVIGAMLVAPLMTP